MTYIGRFAPSPTGPLHAGSMVAALASWLDARAHQGQWLLRIEDIDTPRCDPAMATLILQQLAACGLHADGTVVYQHTRTQHYAQALQALKDSALLYPCTCSRTQIAAAHAQAGYQKPKHADWVYPRTCRPADLSQQGPTSTEAVAWRAALQTDLNEPWMWQDRRLGSQQQTLSEDVGDFVLKRRDGLWAYQLAVVVDDAEQGITHIVRGEDLADNTPRQQWLQQALHLPTPSYMHTPLVCNEQGEKLSKQTLAPAINTGTPLYVLHVLREAAKHLGLPALPATYLPDWLHQATQAWQQQWAITP